MEEAPEGAENRPKSEDSRYEGLTHLAWNEHIRLRPGMYIGKLGDGSNADDGIYVLLKETIDNSIDEFTMGFGSKIIVDVTQSTVTVRDYGRGIPLNDVVDAVSRMNTGAKYDNKAFKKSVGLNGVGLKAVNALSSDFEVRSVRNGMMKMARFCGGELVTQFDLTPTDEPNGTFVQFTPDASVFKGYRYDPEHIIPLLKNYTYLNTGLSIIYNGKRMSSRGGLLDLLKENMSGLPLYEPIYLKGDDIEIAFTHANQYGEEYYTFVNGQHTTQG
ncbi:MAG: ATP-binding protein, partial [Muribaculaceae bacterium]|nr:ATP-binding protein [Muribaculaceae bacterium]